MATFNNALTDKQIAFISEQPMFFTASACATGHVNLSPKGMDSFRVLSPNLCGYMDMVGSGNETSAHLKHDGRLTIMFNSFSRNALIMRLYGKGRVARPDSADFEKYKDKFTFNVGTRQIILIEVETIQESCGYAVPEMELVNDRLVLQKWAENKGPDALVDYQKDNNSKSMDGFDTGLFD